MGLEAGSIEHLAQVISHVVAPAFLLTAVGSFTSVISDRLLSVAGRIGQIQQSGVPEHLAGHHKQALQRLRSRARLLNVSILFAILSGVVAVLLIIGTFLAALRNVHHVWVAAALFMTAAIFLFCALVTFAVDVKMALTGHDLH